MIIPQHVFRAYDIRGLSSGEIDLNFAVTLGQAFVPYTGERTVVVGRDARVNSPELAEGLIRGLHSQGARVTDIGLVTTPMFYFAVASRGEIGAGIMVTASHNPPEYNGFKPVRAGASPISSQALQDLRKVMEDVGATRLAIETRGTTERIDIREKYLENILNLVDTGGMKDLTVAIDGANGMAGVILPLLFERIGSETLPLYWEIDCTFPHHEANPSKPENLKELQRLVLDRHADLGIAYDGDADRIGFVDEKGAVIPSDIIGALLVPEILSNHPGGLILSDVRSTKMIADEVIRLGGAHEVSPVGHGLIKPIMKERGAVFAIERSGHFYFQDFYGMECPDLVALMVMEKMVRSGKRLSEFVAPLDRYTHSGEINFTVSDKENTIATVRDHYSDGSVSRLDGLRVDFPDWWFSLRASNTEPLLRLNVEATSRELMAEKRDELIGIIRKWEVKL